LSDRDTILFATKQSETLRAHLQPLKAYLLRENLSNEETAAALDVRHSSLILIISRKLIFFLL